MVAPKPECTHPTECRDFDEYGNSFCAWCEQVADLTRDNASLLAALKEKAVIVNGGTVKVDGPIGYLAIHGGCVCNDSPTVSVTNL